MYNKARPAGEIAYLTEVGHASWYHGLSFVVESNIAISPPLSQFVDVWYAHPGMTQNYLFFDSHVERLKTPPHPMDYRAGQVVTLADGSTIDSDNGTVGFLSRFHNGQCPVP